MQTDQFSLFSHPIVAFVSSRIRFCPLCCKCFVLLPSFHVYRPLAEKRSWVFTIYLPSLSFFSVFPFAVSRWHLVRGVYEHVLSTFAPSFVSSPLLVPRFFLSKHSSFLLRSSFLHQGPPHMLLASWDPCSIYSTIPGRSLVWD